MIAAFEKWGAPAKAIAKTLVAAALISTGSISSADARASAVGANAFGCLDADFNTKTYNGFRRNVIAWPRCHRGQNQNWKYERTGMLSVTVNGRKYCLTVDQDSRAGKRGAGRNVFASRQCHGGLNQRWYLSDGQTLRSTSNDFCLDMDRRHFAGRNGAGRNVIAWPNCHGGGNQRWATQNIAAPFEDESEENQNVRGCGWYAVYSCHGSRWRARRDQRKAGYGFIVNTRDVPNFRNGYFCVADRAGSRWQAKRLRRQAGLDFKSAYIKKGC